LLPYSKCEIYLFRFLTTIQQMLEKDLVDNQAIGDKGAKEILSRVSGDSQVRVITHCNTGSLATAGYGTALGVIRSLHAMKRLGKTRFSPHFPALQLLCYRTRVLYRN